MEDACLVQIKVHSWGQSFLFFLPSAVFFSTVSPFVWSNISPILVIIPAISIPFDFVTLFLAHFRDPGILPRKRHSLSPSYQAQDNFRLPPATKDLIINGNRSKLKFCDTCRIYRPPRSSHCSTCDNCVEKFDHHCPWVGNCVGQRNYRYFILFVTATTFNLVYVFGISLAALGITAANSSQKGMPAIVDSILKLPFCLVLMIYCFFLIWSVGGLTCYHYYLVSLGVTTNEELKGLGKKKPYTRGCLNNFLFTLCGPWTPSYLNLRKVHFDPKEPLDASVALEV